MHLVLRKLFSKSVNGDIEKLSFEPEMRGEYNDKVEQGKKIDKDPYPTLSKKKIFTYDDSDIEKFSLYELFQLKGVKVSFDDLTDKAFGLGITIHDVWALKVEISKYQVLKSDEGNVIGFKGIYTLHLYDNFGLDDGDIGPDKEFGGNIYNFWAWYILQRHTKFNGKYKPFINMISISYDMADYIKTTKGIEGNWRVQDGLVTDTRDNAILIAEKKGEFDKAKKTIGKLLHCVRAHGLHYVRNVKCVERTVKNLGGL